MARHRKIRHHHGGHAARHWISLAGKVIGGAVVASPAINAVASNYTVPQNIPPALLFNYTGIGNNGAVNWSQTIAGIGTVAGGLILMKVFSYIAKRF